MLEMVSHDLRGPLSAILLSTDSILRTGQCPLDLEERLKRIHKGAERAIKLVRDLLDLGQARTHGRIRIFPAPMDLHAATDVAVDEVSGLFPQRKIARECLGPASGHWDIDRVVQVGVNLVTNAAKYSAEGTVIEVRTGGDDRWAYLEVHNQGEPIPGPRMRHLFEPPRAGELDVRRQGLGLGLFIVDQLVRSHKGVIAVDSTRERGTTVLVRFPRTTVWT
jgi:sigma-B regulation protein RsbU (phosphoserine phosphatase)